MLMTKIVALLNIKSLKLSGNAFFKSYSFSIKQCIAMHSLFDLQAFQNICV